MWLLLSQLRGFPAGVDGPDDKCDGGVMEKTV